MLNACSTPRRKDRWLIRDAGANQIRAGPVCGKFSVHETHRVTHLVMIIFVEEVKDTVTLLLFYLLDIWECVVLPVGNVFFRRRFRDDLALNRGPQEDRCFPLKHRGLQAGGGSKDAGAATLNS